MSYKVVIFGILLILTVPAVSSAQVFFQAKASGTDFCNDAPGKFKGTLFFEFFGIGGLLIATDANFLNIIATMQQDELYATSQTDGVFIYVQDDVDGFGVFQADFQTSGNLLTTFTGSLDIIYSDDCFEDVTFKSAQPLP